MKRTSWPSWVHRAPPLDEQKEEIQNPHLSFLTLDLSDLCVSQSPTDQPANSGSESTAISLSLAYRYQDEVTSVLVFRNARAVEAAVDDVEEILDSRRYLELKSTKFGNESEEATAVMDVEDVESVIESTEDRLGR